MNNIPKLKVTSFLWALVFFMPIVSLYMLAHGVSLSVIVISQVFYSLFTILGAMPTGIIADKFGAKQAIIVGHVFNAISITTILFFPTALGLYVTYGLLGFGDSFLSGSKEALLYESTKEKGAFQKQYSSLLSYEILGFALSALLVGFLLGQYGAASYRPLIIATIVAKVLAAVISFSLKNAYAPIKDEAKGPKAITLLHDSFKLIRSNKVVFTIAAVTILTLNGEYFMFSVFQPYFQAAKVNPFFIGFVLSAGAFLNFFFVKYAYLLEQKLTLNRIILLLNYLLGAAYIAMAIFITPIALVGLFIVMNGLYNVQWPIITDYVNEHSSSHIRATVLSGIEFVKQGIQIFVRIGLGVLVGLVGIGHTILIQGIYLFVGASLAYVLIKRLGDLAVHHYAGVVGPELSQE